MPYNDHGVFEFGEVFVLMELHNFVDVADLVAREILHDSVCFTGAATPGGFR